MDLSQPHLGLSLRQIRWLLWVALGLAALATWAFVLRGADAPADPTLGAPVDESGSTIPTPSPGTGGAAPTPSADPGREPLPGFGEVAITVDPPGEGGGLLAWCLLAAASADQRARGLMEVTDLQGYPGMAFLYDEPVTNAFYMRNTPMPLSIAWIAEDGSLVSSADMDPCEDRDGCPIYPPAGPYRTAIEVPQGRLGELGVVEGAKVTVGGACPAA